MSEWEVKTLGQCISVSSGEGLPESKMKPGPFVVYGGNGSAGMHNQYMFEKEQLIIGRVGAQCGNVHITKAKSWITDNALIVTFLQNRNDMRFWYYILSNLNLRNNAFESAQPVITGGIISKTKASIPPYDSQVKISSILTNTDSVIDKTQAAIAKYQAIKQGMLHDLFTRGIDAQTGKLRPAYKDAPELYKESKLGMVPKEWVVETVGGLCTMKSGEGITSKSIREIEDYPVYGGNGLRGFTSSFTHEGEYILIGRQGALCGNITRVRGKFYASEHAVVVTVFDKNNVDWLSQKLDDMNLNQYSEASAQPGLSVNKILKLPISKPPFDEQNRIADSLIAIDTKIQIEQNYLHKLQQLKAGLMSDLLSGKKKIKSIAKIEEN
jgi:type I restriction enzyme S subunit